MTEALLTSQLQAAAGHEDTKSGRCDDSVRDAMTSARQGLPLGGHHVQQDGPGRFLVREEVDSDGAFLD